MNTLLAMIDRNFRQVNAPAHHQESHLTVMNENWKKHLISQGARISGHHDTDFGEPTAETTVALQDNIICPLSHYGLIRVSGDDARDFLQNQFCNDVRKVSAEHSQLNGYCSPKGRVLAFFRLFQQGDDYLLRLPQDVLEPTLKRLRMFVMMSKVTLEEQSDAMASMGLAGATAEQLLTTATGSAPTDIDACLHMNHLTIIRVPGKRPRFEIHGSESAVRDLWDKLTAQARPVGNHAWILLDIHAGLPDVVGATQEAFVPQMLNLHALDALSFQKGCYPGQEIVARMRYLGKLKRRMYRAHIDGDAQPQAGDALFAEGSESGQGVGKVVLAQPAAGGGVDLLAVIEIASAEQRKLRLGDAEGPQLQLQALPYSVEVED